MKKLNTYFWMGSLIFLGLAACEKKATSRQETKTPQVFIPATGDGAVQPDSVADPGKNDTTGENAKPITGPAKLPTPAELKTITPSQEAKRALTNDAMKVTDMPLREFGDYMKSRIPYYRGKGDLKFENDIVRIRINQAEMLIETQKDRLTFSMQ